MGGKHTLMDVEKKGVVAVGALQSTLPGNGSPPGASGTSEHLQQLRHFCCTHPWGWMLRLKEVVAVGALQFTFVWQ